jgi:3-hydroxyacyl-[acyl-carrier-protein] dehydratase
LNPDDAVYHGHFPGNPVVPGVCQVEIIREIVSGILSADLSLISSDNIKFLGMINPGINPELDISLVIKKKEEDKIDVTGKITHGEQVFLKFRGVFR